MMKRAGRVRSRAAERPRRTNVPYPGHVPWHGDEYFFKWYYGVLDPLKWMHDHYRLIHTRQWPDALLSRVDQGLVIIQVSSRWEESREENNPLLMAKMAGEVAVMMFAGGQVDFEKLAIKKSATRNVLANKKIGAFLSRIPASGSALLVFHGPECTSVMKSDWALFAGKNAVWIACCVDKTADGRSGGTNPLRRRQLVQARQYHGN